MLLTLLFLALCGSAFLAGSAYTTLFALSPSGLTGPQWVVQMQHAIPRIGVPLFVLQPIAVSTTIACAVLARADRAACASFGAAAALFAVAGIITRTVHIPINEQMRTSNAELLPAGFDVVQRRWWRFHIVRSALLMLGFGVLALAALTMRR